MPQLSSVEVSEVLNGKKAQMLMRKRFSGRVELRASMASA